jgi:predicted ATPase
MEFLIGLGCRNIEYRTVIDAIKDARTRSLQSGDEPLARFAMEFRTALGRRDIEYEGVIAAIKDARTWSRTRAAANKWGPSPFDE